MPFEPVILPVLNKGVPFRVVRVGEEVGILDEETQGVWLGHDLVPRHVTEVEPVALPDFPEGYGEWLETCIGGVSETIRRVGLLSSQGGKERKKNSPVTLFALSLPRVEALASLMTQKDIVTLGDPETTQSYGIVQEIIVHEPSNVAYVCSVVARQGGVPRLDDVGRDSRRPIGVERLDRIGAKVVQTRDMVEEEDQIFGIRRGFQNWKFPWLPPSWPHVPLTWDHLVKNFDTVSNDEISSVPQPLLQHICKQRLETKAHPEQGCKWSRVDYEPLPSEVDFFASHPDSVPPPPLRRIVHPPTPIPALQGDGFHVDTPPWSPSPAPNTLMHVPGEGWFRSCDTTRQLTRHIPSRRFVSGALKVEQSKQLILCFYLQVVERVTDPTLLRALCLIQYRYMVQRGYFARWLGPYVQNAMHVGNGDTFRTFRRMTQYRPESIPSQVLNRIVDKDGHLCNRGSKGTRSKYEKDETKRYNPKRRMQRRPDDEEQMKMR